MASPRQGAFLADAPIPVEVRQLLARHLHTMEQVEALLLLARSGDRSLSADEVRTGLRLEATADLSRTLARLESSGLVAVEAGAPPRYRYAPSSVESRTAVELLAVAYNERPVTLVRMIYDRPSPVQSFADAFRVRKGEGS